MAWYPLVLACLFLLCYDVTLGSRSYPNITEPIMEAYDTFHKLFMVRAKLREPTAKVVAKPETKASPVESAFSDDMQTCMFKNDLWPSVLSGQVECNPTKGLEPLCYAPKAMKTKALFVVCYDTTKLIPAYTAHIATPVTGSVPNRPTFKPDSGTYAPNPQAAVSDYDQNKQTSLPGFDASKNFYCAKGHLVPNADYGSADADEAATTFILTNVAPQWQKFNGGNWLRMEEAVRAFTNSQKRNVYVFTGTGGEAKDQNKQTYMLNDKVVAPKYYWILVCDPVGKQMVVYVGVNPVGDQSTKKVPGCNNAPMTKNLGVVYCYSYDEVENDNDYSDFLLPPMDNKTCPTATKGNFLKPKFS